ncbi:hypothetical protein B566_EDAN010310 [Ephemera danica]|nr:hypothetical protein B566_EDAN010310 [Ephemera danica]
MAASQYCITNLGMELPGLESPDEWTVINTYMRVNGRVGLYWTNGASTDGGNTWTWGGAPPTFDDRDTRWATKEPGDGNPDYSKHHVAFQSTNVGDGQIYSEDDSSLLNTKKNDALAVCSVEFESREWVILNGKNYTFTHTEIGASWQYANDHCASLDKRNWYWTNAATADGSSWQWGTSGVTFTGQDPRWANGEPNTGNPDFAIQHVSMHVQEAALYSDGDDYLCHVFCESV